MPYGHASEIGKSFHYGTQLNPSILNVSTFVAIRKRGDYSMGRSHQITKLTPEQQAKVTGTIRRYQYEHLDLVLSDLAVAGIKIARSTLHRHVQGLKKSDLGTNGVAGSTLVITIDLKSGGSTQTRTAASPSLVISAVGALDSAGNPHCAG